MLEVDGFAGKANILGLVRRVRFSEGVLSVEGLGYADAREVLAALDVDRLRAVPELTEAPTAGRQCYVERVAMAGEGAYPAPRSAVQVAVAEAVARPVVPPRAASAVAPWEEQPAPRVEVPRDLRAPSAASLIPPEVKAATSLEPVVAWLWAGSNLTPEAQVETMKALADTGHCPLLATLFATMAEEALFRDVSGCMSALGYSTDGGGKLLPVAPTAPAAPAPATPAASPPASPPLASPGAVAAHAEAPAGVPDVVAKAQHLRVVVDYVVERLPVEQRKNPSLDAVARGVAALSPSVPLVARIESSKLRGRVERTMTAMDLLPTA